jgi:hypothetical protein
MMIRIYDLTGRSRGAALALGAAALGLGMVVLAFGIVLLIGVAVVGTIAAGGVLLYRSLTGRGTSDLPRGHDPELDPSLEVFPDQRTAPPLPHSPTRPQTGEPD